MLEKINAENNELLHLAKRACVSYLRSIHLMKDKNVFDISKVDAEKLAFSYGLVNAPTVSLVPSDKKMSQEDRIAKLRAAAKARKL